MRRQNRIMKQHFKKQHKQAISILREPLDSKCIGLRRIYSHAKRTISLGVLGDRERCIAESTLVLSAFRQEFGSTGTETGWFNGPFSSEEIWGTCSILEFVTYLSILKHERSTLQICSDVWLTPKQESYFTTATTPTRLLLLALIACSERSYRVAGEYLDSANEALLSEEDSDTAHDDPLATAVRGVIEKNGQVVQCSVESMWSDKRRIFEEDGNSVFSLFSGTILGEGIAVIGRVSRVADLVIPLPEGPLYWF